ncbi:hypothetical protein [Pantoea sp. CCBC3-3-1]|uniref:hypothetical protein n=1 Tax=Pantoea sp. CCBC3-3-1 TaxID=2490851 RepID=UPI0011BE9969|nr:hypothetical protein [Pantoea sp. CCBC3-3-1]
MNQRLLVILALLLLVVGIVGLKFSGEERVEAMTDVTTFTATKALIKGEPLTKESYSKQVVRLPVKEAPTEPGLPESLEGYQVVNNIAAGEALTRKDIEYVPRETVSLKSDHYIYPVPVRNADLFLLTRLKKGDEVNVYLRYFIRQQEDETKRVEFIDGKGKSIINKTSKMVWLLGPKRFFSAEKMAGNEGEAAKTGSSTVVYVELSSDDLTRIYAVRHLGDTVLFPASASPGNKQGAIPELVTQLRGRQR